MSRDRRSQQRAELGRRTSDRLADYRMVRWRADCDASTRCGWLVEWSATGLAMITEHTDTPPMGARLMPHRGSKGPGFLRPVTVKRITSLSPALSLVAGTYVSGDSDVRRCLHPAGATRDRRGSPRAKADRRRSTRWPIDKPIRWRVLRGRRIRSSHVLERSLDGLVMQVEPDDAPHAGTRFFAAGHAEIDSLGFRSAIVRRTETLNDDCRLLFAEIEA